eukprot:12798727-Alexandrium_andersonii.AAC.1
MQLSHQGSFATADRCHDPDLVACERFQESNSGQTVCASTGTIAQHTSMRPSKEHVLHGHGDTTVV